MTQHPPVPEFLRDDALARAVYSEAAGIGRLIPASVATPRTVEEALGLVRWAAERSLSITPRGSGSSMAGGALGDGLIADLSLLDTFSIHQSTRRAWCAPGVLRDTLASAARAQGLRFPVDPSSGAFCTIGGMAATNAAGPHSLRYGAMRKWVTALDCIFADGTRAIVGRGVANPQGITALERFDRTLASKLRETDRSHPVRHAGVVKNSSGYGVHEFAESGDVVDLLIGSEGTLALIVGIEVRLIPPAEGTSSLMASFASLEDTVKAATSARELGAAVCELLDASFLRVVKGAGSLPPTLGGAEALLLVEAEGATSEQASTIIKAIESSFKSSGATSVTLAMSALKERELWDLRHAASPILSQLPGLKSVQVVEDAAVPPAGLPDYVRGVRSALEKHGVDGVIFGHAGDAHVHVNPLLNFSDEEWRPKLEAILDDVTGLAVSLGGTLSGEHGDGRLRAPLLPRVWTQPGAMAAFAAIKKAFDPDGILNPGVKLALPGQRPIEDVKYDPSLEPLPGAARKALDFVAKEKAYARNRLSLLEGTL